MIDYLYLVRLEAENENVEGLLQWKVGEGLLLWIEISATPETQGRWGARHGILTHAPANCSSQQF